MPSLLLTRKEVDELITNHPKWMEGNFRKLERQWSLGGVRVSGSIALIEEITKLQNKA